MRLLPLPGSTRDALLTHKQTHQAQFDKTNSYRNFEDDNIAIDDDFPLIAGKYDNRVGPSTLSRW